MKEKEEGRKGRGAEGRKKKKERMSGLQGATKIIGSTSIISQPWRSPATWALAKPPTVLSTHLLDFLLGRASSSLAFSLSLHSGLQLLKSLSISIPPENPSCHHLPFSGLLSHPLPLTIIFLERVSLHAAGPVFTSHSFFCPRQSGTHPQHSSENAVCEIPENLLIWQILQFLVHPHSAWPPR